MAFTSPESGAGAVLTGSPATIADGAVSVTATANSIPGGPYDVTASTTGASSVNFALRNMRQGPAEIHYGKPTAAGAGNCSSWADACTLQTALATAISGDEIWVAAGIYKPTTGTDRAATFQLKNGVALYGGFTGTETARDQRDFVANVTILSGDLNGDDNNNVMADEPTRAENSYHVVTGSGTNNTALLDGFTISGGNANTDQCPGKGCGGGMYNISGSPTMTNVNFSGNSVYLNGGALFNSNNSNPTLTNFTFDGNTALWGGGAALFNHTSSPSLINGVINNNRSYYWGAGIYNHASDLILVNVTLSNNSAYPYSGGGMFNYGSSNPTLNNVTFVGNSAPNGDVMYNTYSSNPSIDNSILWGNTYNDPDIMSVQPQSAIVLLRGAVPRGVLARTSSQADPLLGTLGNYGGSTLTVPLQTGSPAIDAGNDATCAATDQRGVLRPQGAHCDLGAFELSVEYAISGNAGAGNVSLSYTDGTLKTVTSASDGSYSLLVPYGWSGTVTPSKAGYAFTPENRTYTNLVADAANEDYSAGLLPFACSNVTEIPQAECEALVALYNSTNGTGWADHTGWLMTNTPCSWFGVACAAGHVTDLALSVNQLSGSLPAELGNLSNLTHLYLSGNHLTGSLPVGLSSLTNFTHLYMHYNQLSGSIPPELGNLQNLTNLDLERNQLTGGIPAELGNLINLSALDLSDNQLSGSIPAELGNLINLSALDLGSNQLIGSIPAALGSLTNLTQVSLYGNQLSGSIPAALGNMTNFTRLDFRLNHLTGSLPAEFGNLTNLTLLWLHGNQLTGGLPAELGNLANLTDLGLGNNQLSGSIPAELGNLTNLTASRFK